MSRGLIPIFYFVTLAAIGWLFLLTVVARIERLKAIRFLPAVLGPVAILLCFVPVGGASLWTAAFGLWINPSVPLLGLALSGLGERLFGVALLGTADRRATWIFGAVVGTFLYLHATLPGGVDLYYPGADRRLAVGVLAAAAGAFLLFGHRTGILLLAALIAFALGALESPNLWDYVVDPFLWLIGLGVVLKDGIGSWRTARAARVLAARVAHRPPT